MSKKEYFVVQTDKSGYPLILGDYFNKFECEETFLNIVSPFLGDKFRCQVLSSRTGNRPRKEVLLKCYFDNGYINISNFYIYLCPLEGGGRYETEYRIQFYKHDMWTPDLNQFKIAYNFCQGNSDLNDKECYFLGIYKISENNDDIVLCGVYPSVISQYEDAGDSTKSIQVDINYIKEAYENGYSIQLKTDGTRIVCFKPSYIVWYMINRDKLHLSDLKKISSNSAPLLHPLQIIYYGAPGTGKSNEITKYTNEDNSIRTTFHPDSDYASFVGCYKPTVEPIKSRVYKKLEELKEEAKTINESSNEKVAQIIPFITKYADDLLHIVETQPEVKSLQNLLKAHLGFNADTYLAYVVNYVLKNHKKEITYKFCPQAFTNAYVEAWKDTNKPYYLVIEEINRGNCAQIFGDIFQLLDRGEDGKSSYEITPDKDLQQHLAEEFEDVAIDDTNIKEGKKMRLPSNLYIHATMNTSDQSLFPIDSAFKRRWDWKYIPIKDEGKNYKIVVDKAKYDWYKFIKLVNDRIENVTDSEDKQIGYWFAKANENGEISAETMVSKVLFYLWNDVFKDYAHSQSSLFHTGKRKYKFREFYNDNGDVNIDLLNEFLVELKLVNETPKTEETQSGEE